MRFFSLSPPESTTPHPLTDNLLYVNQKGPLSGLSVPIGIEDADDSDLHLMLAVVVETEGLGHPLSLVVAGPGPHRIHVAPIILLLRMNLGVAIDLAGGGVLFSVLTP
jgi:hypothetical protein